MGCDGGTIPRRDELVRVKKKPEQVSILFILYVNPFLFNHDAQLYIYFELCSVSDVVIHNIDHSNVFCLIFCAERQRLRVVLSVAALQYHTRTPTRTHCSMWTWSSIQ